MKLGKGTNHKEHNPHLQQQETFQRAANNNNQQALNRLKIKYLKIKPKYFLIGLKITYIVCLKLHKERKNACNLRYGGCLCSPLKPSTCTVSNSTSFSIRHNITPLVEP